MVLGDTVNTASRLQSIAAPGTVLVDDVTRRASEAAIAYEDAGEHQVKGREQPVHAGRALRVVAGAGGARRSAGLEAPFVGARRRAADDHRRRGRQRADGSRARHVGGRRRGRGRASRGCCGSSSSTSTESRRFATGIRAGASPTARESRTGRWRRWSAREPEIAEEESPAVRAREAPRHGRASSSPTSGSAGWSSRGWRTCCASRSARTPTAPTCSAAGACSSSGFGSDAR